MRGCIVLSDVRMPGMSGPELVAELCARKPVLRALLMTGFGEGIRKDQPVLEKPFRMTELQTMVDQALGFAWSARLLLGLGSPSVHWPLVRDRRTASDYA